MAEPLTPAECDLQDFPFMPLHVARLRDSDLAATVDPEAAWYAVMLWAASWHQIPAASLPNDDQVLTRLCGLGRDVKTFRKNRGGAMHGFVLCDDDRWYHPVVAEQANAAWKAKLEQRWRTECARIKKHNQRHETDVSAPSLDEFIASGCQPVPLTAPPKSPNCPQGHGGEVPRENTSKRQGQREGEGQGESIIEDDDGARARAAPSEVEIIPVDLPTLTDMAARAAGVRHIEPGPIARANDLVREWIAHGATPDEIISTIQAGVVTASEPVRSLRYFDAHIRQTVARRENPHGTRQSPVRSSPRSSASGRLLAAIAAEEAERPH
ncbi:hypothetical protein AI27_06450 [Sphingomonas sp. BHC-A]|nr:hypothetical protein AI27_06450 [Sphingomonas sp. BHC-A]